MRSGGIRASTGVRPRWVLVDSAPRILGQVPDSLARFAARTLVRRGVEILSSTALASIDRGGAVLSDGRRIETETVVWTAGVAANPVAARLGLPLDARGRVPVDELFRVEGLDGVHALGDIAAVPNAGDRRARPADLPARAAPGPPARRATCAGATKPYALQVARLDGHARPPPRHRDRRRRCACAASSAGPSPAATTCWRCRSSRRRARVLADWTVAACFRRDVVELTP